MKRSSPSTSFFVIAFSLTVSFTASLALGQDTSPDKTTRPRRVASVAQTQQPATPPSVQLPVTQPRLGEQGATESPERVPAPAPADTEVKATDSVTSRLSPSLIQMR